MPNVNKVSQRQLPQGPTAAERVGKIIASAAVISVAACSIFAIVAVSVPSAGAPAWLAGAALYFESLAVPSLLGFVIPVKAVVYCLAGITLLLAGCVGLVAVTSKPMTPEQIENLRRLKVRRKLHPSPGIPVGEAPEWAKEDSRKRRHSAHAKSLFSSEPSLSRSSSRSLSRVEDDIDDDAYAYTEHTADDIVRDDSPAPQPGTEFVRTLRPATRFYSSSSVPTKVPSPARPGLHIGRTK